MTVTVTYLAEKGFDLEMTMGNVYVDGDLGSSRCVGEMRCPSYCKYWKGTGECWLRYFGAASLLIQIQMVPPSWWWCDPICCKSNIFFKTDAL